MNKRQVKKMYKKVTYPLVDEMNLLTLSSAEYNKAIEDYEIWIRKHCRYKHYKNKSTKIGIAYYHFPVGERCMKELKDMIKITRGWNIKTETISQNLGQLTAK